MAKVAQIVRDSSVIDAKKESDTIRLWESYKEQALLWRSIALLQIPGTLIAILCAMFFWVRGDTLIHVPAKPLPGTHLAEDIPDNEFVDVATNFVNLIATYQPTSVHKQFDKAQEMTFEPLTTRFKIEWLDTELRTVETTSRTQVYFADPTKTSIVRENDRVTVSMTGERLKYVAGKQIDPIVTKFSITMETVPHNPINPYGIVVTNLAYENIKPE